MDLKLSVRQQAFVRNMLYLPHLLVQEVPGQTQYAASTDTERKSLEGLKKWFVKVFKEKIEFAKNGEVERPGIFEEEKACSIRNDGGDFLLKIVEHYNRAGSGVTFCGAYEDLVAQLKGKPCSIPDFSEEDKAEFPKETPR